MTSILIALATLFNAGAELRGVEIYSKQAVRFGRWEIRMKAAAAPGTVSSFFTYYNDSYLGTKPWREIDIEVLGKNPSQFQSNLITGMASSKVTSEQHHRSSTDLSTSYHTYVLEWTPDSIVWRLDGNMVRRTSAPNQQVIDLRDTEQTYRMNVWASTSTAWVGALDYSKLPQLQIVRYIRFSNYTPGAGPGRSNFTQAWIDTFKTLDRNRWALGDWTFDENYATFSEANCRVRDGHLIMMLSTTANEGSFPSTFLHDTESPTSVTHDIASGEAHLTHKGKGLWHMEGNAKPLEAFDLRGNLLARGTMSGEGQSIDLSRHDNAIVIVRQGTLSARLLPGATGIATLR